MVTKRKSGMKHLGAAKRFLSLGIVVFSISLFSLADAQDRDAAAPHLRYAPPLPMAMFQEIQMTAEVTDLRGVRSVRFFYRKRGEPEYKMLSFEKKEGNERKGVYVRSISRMQIGPEGLEYYLVAENEAGRQASKGKADRPLFMKAVSYRSSEVRQRFVELKQACEERNLRKVKELSDLSKSREAFLRQLFETYRSINIELKVDETEMTEETASALFTIKTLVDRDGNAVIPGAEWTRAQVQLSSLRDEQERWKIIWK